MRNRLAIALVVVALLIGISIAFMLGWVFLRRGAPTKFINTATVVQQIQSLSELVTVKYVMEKVVPAESPGTNTFDNLPIISGLRDDKMILLAHGVVKAGVDLSQVRPEDIEISPGRISLRIPAARVTDAYLDEQHTQVIDRQTGLLRRFDKNLEKDARRYTVAEIQRGARQNGIEREANERARAQLMNFLKALGFTEVEVRSAGGQ